MERYVDVAPGIRLWAWDVASTSAEPREPLLLVMGADDSGVAWPDPFVALLAEHHRVIVYDHRDTGRSTASFEDQPYGPAELAADAIAILDAFAVPRAHVVGMAMGGLLVQLLMLDHPDRLLSATVFCAGALPTPGAPGFPRPGIALQRMWGERDDERDLAGELAWRVAYRRLLNGTGTSFDADASRALEERIIAHTGHHEPATAHNDMGRAGLERGAELAAAEVPLLVIEAPEDPVFPPPHSGELARAVARGRLTRIPGMGHAINRTVTAPLAAAILTRTTDPT